VIISIPQKQNLLNSGTYFYCEREHCLMKKESCLLYQKWARTSPSKGYMFHIDRPLTRMERYHCINCPQGREIAQEAATLSG